MELLDSFTIDHTLLKTPGVRIAKTISTPCGDIITVFDLRFCTPNKTIISEKGIHTLEHLLACFMRNHLNNNQVIIIDISPMGCRTGFYMSLIGTLEEKIVIEAWKSSMLDVLKIKDHEHIPGSNIYQCGTAHMHSLIQAKEVAKYIITQIIHINKNETLILKKAKLNALNI